MVLWVMSKSEEKGKRESIGCMTPREACPQCGSRWDKRNGHIDTGKQNHRGKVCGRAFVRNPQNSVIIEEQRVLIGRLHSLAL